jgi:hypothetical protein
MSTNSDTPAQKPGSDAGKVETKETLRPPDKSVVTSDLPEVEAQPEGDDKAKSDTPAAAGDDDKSKSGSNDQESATGDDKDSDASKKRISRGNRANRRLRKQMAEQKKRIDDLEAQLRKGGDKPPAETPEPKPEDFSSTKDYAKAYAKWEREQSDDKGQPAKKPDDDTQQPGKPTEDELKEITDFYDAGVKKYGDEYAEAVQEPDLRIDKSMAEFMFDSDHGHEIMMHLANNPDESQAIFGKSERRVLRSMTALEEKAKAGKLDIDVDSLDIENDKGGKDGGKKAGEGGKPSGSDRYTPPSDTKDKGSSQPASSPENESMDDYAARRQKENQARGIR